MTFLRSHHPAGLDERIRARLIAGYLPRNARSRYFVGPGDGGLCACCERAIADFSEQYDVERADAGEAARFVAMHRGCFDCWRDIAADAGKTAGDPAES